MLKVITSIVALSISSFTSYKYLSAPTAYSENLKSVATHVNGITDHPWKAEFNQRFEGYDSQKIQQHLG